MNKTILASALALSAAILTCGSAQAAKLTLLNDDVPGVGLNDMAVATPSGGNPGKTVGEQRRIVYQYAMDAWGAIIESGVDIKIYASFAPLTCTPTSGTLGQAGANWIFSLSNRLYPSALADAVLGFDAHDYLGLPANDPGDIFSQFNGALGTPTCLTSLKWYYGLDGRTPAGAINFLNVVMHEIGHGLGAASFINKTSGAFNGGRPDVYTRFAYDNVSGKSFEDPTMTSATRALAMRTPGRTVWSGPNVNSQAALILDRQESALRPTAPVALAGAAYELGYASFGPRATTANFGSNQLVLVDDGIAGAAVVGPPAVAAGTINDGCETPFANAAAVVGKIAVIDRGRCGFADKVANAQLNGAVGVVIANNSAGIPIDMGGTPIVPITYTIPSVMVSQADGAAIKANLPVQAGLGASPYLAGTDTSGRTRLYSPSVVAGGSTFSHYDTSLTPNALMEPFDTPSVQAQYNVDLTPALFADIGWTLNPGNARMGTCDTGIDAVATGGLILGANVAANSGVCATQAKGNRTSYLSCIVGYATGLVQKRIITSAQYARVLQCASTVTP